MLRFRPLQIHFLIMSFLVLFAVVVQTSILAKSGSPWLHIDLLTILAVYMAVEHHLYSALFRLMFGAVCLQSFSSATGGLFIMYYLQLLVIACLVSRRLVLWNGLTQIALFTGLYLFKYLLVYSLFLVEQKNVDLFGFLVGIIPGFIVTTACVLPIFRLLALLDQRFEVQRAREELVV